MTQKEKAERYDEAIETARKINSREGIAAPHDFTICEVIFPELKESEDESIKREIIGFIRNAYWTSNRKRYNELVAWLEKQGEKKETTYDEDMLGAIEYCKKNNRPLEKEHIAWLEKQSEQKPATWSKKDEDYLLDVNAAVDCYFGDIYAEELRGWLKSIKERYTWKPSDEQMAALSDINCTGCISYAGQGQELVNLYNDLKKLRKEE